MDVKVFSGYAGLDGAQYALNISLNSNAGQLLPSGTNAVPGLFLGNGVDVWDVLVTLSTKDGLELLNSTQASRGSRVLKGSQGGSEGGAKDQGCQGPGVVPRNQPDPPAAAARVLTAAAKQPRDRLQEGLEGGLTCPEPPPTCRTFPTSTRPPSPWR